MRTGRLFRSPHPRPGEAGDSAGPAASGRIAALLSLLKWLHGVLLLSPLPAALYSPATGGQTAAVCRVFLVSLIAMALLTALFQLLEAKAQGLLLYLAGSAVGFVLLFLSFPFWRDAIPGEAAPVVVFVLLTAETALLFLDHLLMRLDENRRRRARKEKDPGWQEESRLLQKPEVVFLLCFILLYLLGLFSRGGALCSIALGHLIVYSQVLLLYRYVVSTHAFLRNVRQRRHVPAGRIRRSTAGILAAALCLSAFFGILSLSAAGARRYPDLSGLRAERPVPQDEELFRPGENPGSMELPQELLAMGEDATPSVVWELLTWLAVAAVTVLLFLSAIAALRGLFLSFRRVEEDNEDEIRELAADEGTRLKTDRRLSSIFSERERIRRRYRRMIRRGLKRRVPAGGTPTEIETEAGLSGSEEMAALHVLYEEVRYGDQGL